MAPTLNPSRKVQYVAEVTIDHADLTSAAEFNAIDMPAGTVLDDLYVAFDTDFDPTTSAVIEFGTAGATNTLVASQNIFTGQTNGTRACISTVRGTRFTTPTAIVGKYTSGGGTATQGSLRLIALFHYENESDFTVTI